LKHALFDKYKDIMAEDKYAMIDATQVSHVIMKKAQVVIRRDLAFFKTLN
jgi:hypothetical protein